MVLVCVGPGVSPASVVEFRVWFVVRYVGDGDVSTCYLLIYMLFTVTLDQSLVAGQLSHA
jgi:hypothetical protein